MRRGIRGALGVLAVVLTLTGCGNSSSINTQGEDTVQEEDMAQREDSVHEEDRAQEVDNTMQEEDEVQKEDAAQEEDRAQEEDAAQEEDRMQEDMGAAEAESQASVQSGTFSILGDSISTFRGYNPEGCYVFFPENGAVSDVSDTWWQQVAEEMEWTLLSNSSSSGAKVVGDSTGTESPQCGCNELRTGGLAGPDGACPERIIVYLGANDLVEMIPLGDNDGTRPVAEGEVTAFSDAYTLMLDKLQAKYPEAKIYCCTLPQMGNFGTETPFVEFVNGFGLTAKDYGNVIAEIAEAKGLFVIDLYDCGITVENMPEMTTDGVHPTAAGMRCIADAVIDGLIG